MKVTLSNTLFIAFLFSTGFNSVAAQTTLDEAVRRADVTPAWPGCDAKMSDCTKSRMADFIAANLQIPPEAKAEGAGGVVMMEFVVEKNGNIGEVKPIVDPGLGLGAEAKRVIELMRTKKIKWTPAEVDGKRVAYRYTVPVSFNLNLPKTEKAPVTAPVVDPTNQVYAIAEEMPRYAGCENASTQDSIDCTFDKVLSHFKTNLKYPEEAMKNKVQGQVVAEFIIDENGAVTNPTILQGLGSGCDEEALRLISLMPAWIPGAQDGHPVKVKMKMPIVFKLNKE